MSNKLSRRHFLKAAAATTSAYSLMPSSVLGANEKVNLACVGIAAQGANDAKSLYGTGLANVVALCDVAMGGSRTQAICDKFPKAKQFTDFRKMFDEMADDIDAVSIAVPDHAHFPIAMLAMSLGKHIYVEKPLAHTFQEVELLIAAEKKYKVQAQMGNQGHSGNNYFQFKSWVEAGIIKDVTHVDAYMNNSRRWHGWKIDGYPSEPIPEHLDWNGWLSTAQPHPFSGKLHPGNWRSWYDFGNGAFGDWGPHILDTIHRFLDLGLPEEINALKLDGPNDFIFPQASTIQFKFPKRGPQMPAMDICWYDGVKNKPPRPKVLEEGRNVESCGKVMYSKDLVFKGGTHSATLRVIPEAKHKEMGDKLPKISGKNSNHAMNFMLAAKGIEKTRSSFNISGPLTQVFLLGVIAQRLGGNLKFDRKTKQITNNKVANQLLIGPPPRKEWEEFYKL